MAALAALHPPRLLIMPRSSGVLGRRLFTSCVIPSNVTECNIFSGAGEGCRMMGTCRSTSKYLRNPSGSSHGRINIIQSYRPASSVPPRMDPDVERIQKSFRGLSMPKPVKYDGDRLIYEVRAANYLKFVKVVFYGTALGGLYMAPDIIVGAWESDTLLTADTIMNFGMLLSGVVVLPILMTLLARRLVLKMYHNEAKNTYVAVVSKNIFGSARNRFHSRDVISANLNLFEKSFSLTAFRVKGRPYFVNATHFASPSDYNKLMHYGL